jgi:hypothetical protein
MPSSWRTHSRSFLSHLVSRIDMPCGCSARRPRCAGNAAGRSFFKGGRPFSNIGHWFRWVFSDFSTNRFIWARDRARELADVFIIWGCIIGVLTTFPLVFGGLYQDFCLPSETDCRDLCTGQSGCASLLKIFLSRSVSGCCGLFCGFW